MPNSVIASHAVVQENLVILKSEVITLAERRYAVEVTYLRKMKTKELNASALNAGD